MAAREVMPVMSSKYLKQMPMAMLSPFERQAQRNHGQSLDRLAARGGLCPSEVLSILHNLQKKIVPDSVHRLFSNIHC